MNDEEEILQRYGTPLEPLDEDEIPAKKPISIEDQIVTDENGRRRFHGAFTGGFSAGFWNTVGSLEGWKPTDFKSSRNEKAPQRIQQRPEDFMDDEDLGEFGIAPQRIQAQNDFKIESASSSRKRKLLQNHNTVGPIPGVPVLAELLRPVEDKIAVRILKSMGWKPGQGIGPRLTIKQKKRTRDRNKREEYVLSRYGCLGENGNAGDNVTLQRESSDADDNEDDDDDENELTFAPDDYETLVCTSKTNRFGLGYTGLSHATSDSSKPAHFNLFGPLEVLDKNNKKLSIRGQAFGVGALEEEDEDIYARDDLSKYDFTLEERKPKPPKPLKHIQDRHIIEGFASAKQEVQYQAPFIVEPPAGFQSRNWTMRKSRFAPLPPEKLQEINVTADYKKAGLGRHDLNPAQRSAILEEQPAKAVTIKNPSLEELQAAQRRRDERTKSLLERITAKSDNFTRGGIINTKGEEVTTADKEMTEVKKAVEQEQQGLLEKAFSKTKNLGSTTLEGSKFKPFLGNDCKQQRYEKFLEANLNDETEIATFLATIQPVELSTWDREMERKEFMQARKIYKPLAGAMSERFVSETTVIVEQQPNEANTSKSDAEVKTIVMERKKEMWKPHALLCKRYNIAEPFGGNLENTELQPAKKSKLSIFDYLETSVNRKDNFQTPIIIPKHIEKPQALVNNRTFDIKSSPAPQKVNTIERTNSLSAPNELPKLLKLPPKTELEKRVEESRDKPASEKVELFRAIFEDSDDEAEKTTNFEIEKLNLPTTTSSKPLSAAAVNLLRNNSPPRGIFTALFTTKTRTTVEKSVDPLVLESENITSNTEAAAPAKKITFKSRSERQLESEHAYGPRLPTTTSVSSTVKSASDVSTTTTTTTTKTTVDFSSIKDIWVERINDINKQSDSDCSTQSSYSSSSSESDATPKRRKKKSKKTKKSADKAREKKKEKKLKKKAKMKKKSKKKKSK